jgi:hypothetical protein
MLSVVSYEHFAGCRAGSAKERFRGGRVLERSDRLPTLTLVTAVLAQTILQRQQTILLRSLARETTTVTRAKSMMTVSTVGFWMSFSFSTRSTHC